VFPLLLEYYARRRKEVIGWKTKVKFACHKVLPFVGDDIITRSMINARAFVFALVLPAPVWSRAKCKAAARSESGWTYPVNRRSALSIIAICEMIYSQGDKNISLVILTMQHNYYN
jgi:hypothetical protein